MRTILQRALAALAALTLLAGCSSQAGHTTLIPDDGMVKASAFDHLRSATDLAIFEGASHDVTYQWLFLGGPSEAPGDSCLGLTFSNADSERVKDALAADAVQEFSFCAKGPIAGDPTLTIYLPMAWPEGEVSVYRSTGPDSEPEPVSSATLVNSPNAIITFSPREYEGVFYLVGTAAPTVAPEPGATPSPQASRTPAKTNQADPYTSGGDSQPSNGQDKYLTDPVPAGKPKPVEPQDVTVDENRRYTATLSISAATILRHLDQFDAAKMSVLPADGVVMAKQKVSFAQNESVFDVLKRETQKRKIHLEFSWTPIYNSAYVEGINNLYEFDCGELSGWMYKVNGWFPNYGASRYQLKAGDKIEWVYTCDLGRDIGGWWEGMEKR